MNQIIIHTDQNGYYFPLFYFLALLSGITIFLVEGSRKKYPLKDLWLILATIVLFGIAGSKLFSVTLPELNNLITSFQFPTSGRKTILGGLTGLLLGFVFALFWLRMNKRVMDSLAIALPVGMAIQRVGCLMAGCCFGKPTGFEWGIHYSQGSMPFSTQVHNGLIQDCDTVTLPLHPTQGYEILCCLLIAILVWRYRKHLKAPGGGLLLSIILYGLSRFFIEFFRDPVNSFIPYYIFGIKLIQWMVLAGIAILTAVLVAREKIFTRKVIIQPAGESTLFRRVSLSMILFVLFLLVRNWFDLFERSIAFVIVLPPIVCTGVDLFKYFSVPKFRFLTILIFCSSFFLMSQSYIPKNAGEKTKYKEISIGGIAGTYYTTYKKMIHVWVPEQIVEGCGGYDTIPGHYNDQLGPTQKLRHQSYVGSAGITFHEVRSKYRRSAWGVYLFGGNETESLSDNSYQKNNLILGINPAFRFDWKWIGFGSGFYAGQFRFAQILNHTHYYDMQQPENTRDLYFLPQVSFRVGPYDVLFAEFNLSRQFPSGSPLQLFRFGLGTGLGRVDGTRLGIGYSTAGFYGETYIPIGEKLAIEGSYANTLQPDMKAAWCFSLGLHYRFDFKTAKVTVKERKKPVPRQRIKE